MADPLDGETCDAWYERYLVYRRELGCYSRRSAWRTWISPRIGHKRWQDVTAEDVEQIRDDLDAAIVARREGASRSGRLLARSAMDVWSALTNAIRVARTSKRRDLRALAGRPNPATDIEPPGLRGQRKARRKTFIYPREFSRLASCTDVPREWRQLYAVAIYTYLRPGELFVLTKADVDLTHRVIRIVKAWHYDEESIKPPKTVAGIRDVPIHSRLMPLLRQLCARAKPEDLLVPVMRSVCRTTLPQVFRRHLRLAGISRPALHESSLLTIRANFRSGRDTGITWLALSGVDVARIMRRAGHEDVRATMKYIKAAEDLSGAFGKPFPPLPRELFRGQPSRRRQSCMVRGR